MILKTKIDATCLLFSHLFGVTTEDLYQETRVTAAREVEEKEASLKDENEWVRRVKLREATEVASASNKS